MAFGVPASLCATALVSSGAVMVVARVTTLSAFQSVVWVAIGSSHSLAATGVAMILSAMVSCTLWVRAISRHVDMALPDFVRALRPSAIVALMAGIGPFGIYIAYGPQPTAWLLPLILGGLSGLAGFLTGVMVVNHPLREEIETVWARLIPSSRGIK